MARPSVAWGVETAMATAICKQPELNKPCLVHTNLSERVSKDGIYSTGWHVASCEKRVYLIHDGLPFNGKPIYSVLVSVCEVSLW